MMLLLYYIHYISCTVNALESCQDVAQPPDLAAVIIIGVKSLPTAAMH